MTWESRCLRKVIFNLSFIRGEFMGELSKLENIGRVIEEQLNKVGITNYDELKKIGSREAWLKIQQIDNSACIHRLYAIEGAIQGVKKTMLPEEIRRELKVFYEENKIKQA